MQALCGEKELWLDSEIWKASGHEKGSWEEVRDFPEKNGVISWLS